MDTMNTMNTTEKQEDTSDAYLPWFPGFYNSFLSERIEEEIERAVDYTADNEGLSQEEVEDKFSYPKAREAMSKAWVNAFSAETGIALEFAELISPKEYNFQTDRLLVKIPHAEILRMASETDPSHLIDTVTERHSSYDGFASFYSSDYEEGAEWQKPVLEWDANQLETLMIAYISCKGGDKEDLLEALYDASSIYEAVDNGWIA